MNSHSNWLRKWKDPNCVTSGNEWGSKPGVLKISRFGWDRAQKAWHCSWRQGKQTTYGYTVWKKWSEEHLGLIGGRLFAPIGICPREAAFTESSLWEQRNWQAPFPSHVPQHNQRMICRNQHSLDIGYLTCLHKALSPILLWNCYSQSQCSGPPPPEEQPNPLPTLPLPTWEFCRASVLAVVVTGLIS